MTRRLVTTAVLACGLVLGCTKSNDPPAETGSATGPVPKKSAGHGWKEGERNKTVTTRTP